VRAETDRRIRGELAQANEEHKKVAERLEAMKRERDEIIGPSDGKSSGKRTWIQSTNIEIALNRYDAAFATFAASEATLKARTDRYSRIKMVAADICRSDMNALLRSNKRDRHE
jgi:hypothetical protein